MMEFTERTALEAGFARVFDTEIRADLLALESQRKERLGKALKYVALALGVAIVLIALIIMLGGDGAFSFFGLVIVGILGVGGAFLAWTLQAQGWASSIESVVMPPICRHVGDLSFDKDAFGPFPLAELSELGLLPNYDSIDRSNRLEGFYRDTSYEMMQVRLKKRTRDSKGNTKTSTVYSGLLFHITVPVRVPGKIMIMRDRGGFGNKLGEMLSFGGARSLPKVTFDNPLFEAAFEVYAQSPEEALRFMPDAFLDNLLAIGETEGGRRGTKGMVAGFNETSFYLCLRRGGGFMEMGSLRRSVHDMEDDLHAIFADIDLGRRIIDRLHGA